MTVPKTEIKKLFDSVEEFIKTEYFCATDQDEYLIRKDTGILFGDILRSVGTDRGVTCIMADMAYNAMKDMDGASSDVARDYLMELIELLGVTPQELEEKEIREASKLVYGDEETFVYRLTYI